jgi:hypothetical protein
MATKWKLQEASKKEKARYLTAIRGRTDKSRTRMSLACLSAMYVMKLRTLNPMVISSGTSPSRSGGGGRRRFLLSSSNSKYTLLRLTVCHRNEELTNLYIRFETFARLQKFGMIGRNLNMWMQSSRGRDSRV